MSHKHHKNPAGQAGPSSVSARVNEKIEENRLKRYKRLEKREHKLSHLPIDKPNSTHPLINAHPTNVSSDARKRQYHGELSGYMNRYYHNTRQISRILSEKIRLRDILWDYLEPKLRSISNDMRLYLVGSSRNGFGSQESDMDFCLLLPPSIRSLAQYETRVRNLVRSSLFSACHKKSSSFSVRNVCYIPARVPIIKFSFGDDHIGDFECDINFNQWSGIHTTHLLDMYCKVDSRLPLLGLFCKKWAQTKGIHGSVNGNLATYHILLMVIQHLQCCHPPVLPSLQTKYPLVFDYTKEDIFLSHNMVPPNDKSLNNLQDVSYLFESFISYYRDFPFQQKAISIEVGHPISVEQALMRTKSDKSLNASRDFHIYIEDPIVRGNTTRCLRHEINFKRIKSAFETTYYALKNLTPPASL